VKLRLAEASEFDKYHVYVSADVKQPQKRQF
jgi:hypothetical protein